MYSTMPEPRWGEIKGGKLIGQLSLYLIKRVVDNPPLLYLSCPELSTVESTVTIIKANFFKSSDPFESRQTLNV